MHPPRNASKSGTKAPPPLRKGKWTVEEEAYVNRIVDGFNSGLLPLSRGTTLRSYLAVKLHCDPMRISKKFAGSSCLGKRVFQPAELSPDAAREAKALNEELLELERNFLENIPEKIRSIPSPVASDASDDECTSTGSTTTSSASSTVTTGDKSPSKEEEAPHSDVDDLAEEDVQDYMDCLDDKDGNGVHLPLLCMEDCDNKGSCNCAINFTSLTPQGLPMGNMDWIYHLENEVWPSSSSLSSQSTTTTTASSIASSDSSPARSPVSSEVPPTPSSSVTPPSTESTAVYAEYDTNHMVLEPIDAVSLIPYIKGAAAASR